MTVADLTTVHESGPLTLSSRRRSAGRRVDRGRAKRATVILFDSPILRRIQEAAGQQELAPARAALSPVPDIG
jgi:hypothetical protein